MKTSRTLELVLTAGLVIVLAMTLYSNWRLRRMLADTNAALHEKNSGPRALAPGDRLPPVAGLEVPARESWLVVIDPACGTCEQVVREVNSLQRDDLTVVALQRPGSTAPVPRLRAGVPLLEIRRGTQPQFTRRIQAVPRVFRLAPGGVIRAVCGSLAECGAT
ncbi:MAG TPA: hypothetical protein VF432_13880 [Thermoanaerobaculia bacterium]